MKISVDGGALNQRSDQHFGTFVFSENLVKALSLYDKKNQYHIYTFKNLKPKLFWMKGRISIEEWKNKQDIFLALNQALPIYSSGKIISFCHGLSYYFYPQYYSTKDVTRLNSQLREMIKRSDKIIVSSEKVKSELTSMYQYIERKVFVLPFGIPLDMVVSGHPERSEGSSDQRERYDRSDSSASPQNDRKPYFLFVGMNHPIKNIDFIKEAFNQFIKSKENRDYKLILVTKNCSRSRLCYLYRNATALLTASYYESFNFPVLEALSQTCPVIGLKSAIIPELKTYVNEAKDNKEFVRLMKIIPLKPSVQSINRLYTQFNWKNYVKNLVRLY